MNIAVVAETVNEALGMQGFCQAATDKSVGSHDNNEWFSSHRVGGIENTCASGLNICLGPVFGRVAPRDKLRTLSSFLSP